MAVLKILCASANPAMDRRLHVGSFSVGEINRAKSAVGFAGGKAAHVAMATRATEVPAAWIGFLGGAIGQECSRQLEDLGIEVVAIRTEANTRVNLEIIDAGGRITEILEPGVAPGEESKQEFLSKIREFSKDALLIISGSLPPGLEQDFYRSLIELARARGARIFLDTSGEALSEGTKGNPDFVKTNRSEAEYLVGRKLDDVAGTVAAAREIIQGGAGSAAITLGQQGLIWVENKGGPAWRARPPRMKAISTVGCGDATLAGFAYARVKEITGEEAIRLATACGAANCLAIAPGRIDFATVKSLLPQIEVERIAF